MSAQEDSLDSAGQSGDKKDDGNLNKKVKVPSRKGSISKIVAWSCADCEKSFTNENDMLLTCEYCGDHKCISCLGMTKAFYKQVSGREDLPWFCKKCLAKSIESVKQTKSIEDRCNEFIFKFQEQIDSRFKVIENEVKDVKETLAGALKSGMVNGEGTVHGQEQTQENIVKQATRFYI